MITSVFCIFVWDIYNRPQWLNLVQKRVSSKKKFGNRWFSLLCRRPGNCSILCWSSVFYSLLPPFSPFLRPSIHSKRRFPSKKVLRISKLPNSSSMQQIFLRLLYVDRSTIWARTARSHFNTPSTKSKKITVVLWSHHWWIFI